VVAQLVEHHTSDQEIVVHLPAEHFCTVIWASYSHLCASVTKQYHLVLD